MLTTSDFEFDLPTDLIASHPLTQRDASRMLVVGADGGLQDAHIRDFLDFLQPGDVVVFNNSRVIPGRFIATAANGKEYEITIHTMGPKHAADQVYWGLARGYMKLHVGDLLTLADGSQIEIISKNDTSGLKFKFLCEDALATLEKIGKMPLPPYMRREEELADRERYQTVYAREPGSMAAPTAGLHFTPELIKEIRERGAKTVNITLHVGAGTWMPVRTENLEEHKMHTEWGYITEAQANIINRAKRVIAVGTTSLRLLESAALRTRRTSISRRRPRVCEFARTTSIFIKPGFRFRAVDVLLTNFHLPKSTLFMLVSAFSGLDEMRNAYKHAVDEKYRFFSYGDCCLLFRNPDVPGRYAMDVNGGKK